MSRFGRSLRRALRGVINRLLAGVHTRLDEIDQKLNVTLDQNISIARTQTGLLEASIQLVELISAAKNEALSSRGEQREVYINRLTELRTYIEELFSRQLARQLQTEASDRAFTSAEIKTCNDRLDELHADIEKVFRQVSVETADRAFTNAEIKACNDRLAELRVYIEKVFRDQVIRQVSVETADRAFTNPEIGLLTYLYSFMPTRIAVDVGAHIGDVSEPLLMAGFEVFAFEPNPPVYRKLVDRLGSRADFHAFNIALGKTDGEQPLHLAQDRSGRNRYNDATEFSSLIRHRMPDDLPFTDEVLVPVQTLSKLHASGAIPQNVSLVKIDTEGFDLEVIRGMGSHRYATVVAEYWGSEIPFAGSTLPYAMEDLVTETKKLGYQWHIVFCRIWGQDQLSFYSNHQRALPNSWGNVVFFRDYDLFARGEAWCAAVLPRTYFKYVTARTRPTI